MLVVGRVGYEKLNGPVYPSTALTHVVNGPIHLVDDGNGKPVCRSLVRTQGRDGSYQVCLERSCFETDNAVIEPKVVLGLGQVLFD